MSWSLPRELEPLKELQHWVAWKAVPDRENPNRLKKLPLDPHTGRGAKADDASTWGTYDEALSRANTNASREGLQVGQNHGVGFEFGVEPCGFGGIDLDHVIREDGTLKPFAQDIVRLMDSYTEISPSRKGLHILFRLNVPMSAIGSRRKNPELGLEIYDTGRYFTVTGNVYGEAKPIAERTEALRQVYASYMAVKEKPQPTPKPTPPPPVEASRTPSTELSDRELWERMFDQSGNGRDIRRLYDGDISAYGEDRSRADMALCCHLAYWTGSDTGRVDAMFRQSGLYRPKWDEKHYGTGQTYGQHTISEAIRITPDYIPPVKLKERPQEESSPYSFGGVAGMLAEQPASLPPVRYISGYLEKSLEGDIGRFQRYAKRKTGYSNIDAKTSLYNGLYVVGAVSSLGKTTFCAQMADQLAMAGEHVLYFVLEQTELELVTKGLSRLTAQEDMSEAVSAIEIRSGRITDAVRRAIAEYKRFAIHEAIIECNFLTTIDTITGTVLEYMSRTGVRPVVFVDYLQLIRPEDTRQTTKDAVDGHIRALKQLQIENELVIVLISSLNRQNYLTTIDFESFKESGGIEYTADVIWGLQLSVMNSEVFDTDKKLKTKRELVRQAKRATPRRIELLCLKNRYGVSSYTCEFDYYAKYDLFLPVEEQEQAETDISEAVTNGNKRRRF